MVLSLVIVPVAERPLQREAATQASRLVRGYRVVLGGAGAPAAGAVDAEAVGDRADALGGVVVALDVRGLGQASSE